MLPKLANIERISKKIWRILGQNPMPFTLQGTNTYLIGEGKNRCLIDTGMNKEGYKELLSQVLTDTQSQINQVIFTHNHPDHSLGIIDIIQLKQPCTFRKFGYDEVDQQLEKEYEFKYEENTLKEDEIIKGEDFTIKVKQFVITTPGHCKDHVCFYLVEEKTFFSGDFILSGSSNVIRNLKQQMDSFKKCLALDVEALLSAHGEAVIGKENAIKIMKEQMIHRQKREDAIVQVLQAKQECLPEEILSIVYPGLNENLVNGALHNISVHIDKLIEDGQASFIKETGKYQWNTKISQSL